MIGKKAKSCLISTAFAFMAIFAVIEFALLLRDSEIVFLKVISFNMSAMIAPCGIAYVVILKSFDIIRVRSYQHAIAFPSSIFVSASILFVYSTLTDSSFSAIEAESLPLYASSASGVFVNLMLIKIISVIYKFFKNRNRKEIALGD